VETFIATDYASGEFAASNTARPITGTADRSLGAPLDVQQMVAFDEKNVTSKANRSNPQSDDRYGVRRLTPRETERLQGFPDNWTRWGADGKEISDSARYRMCGNAVSVTVAQWIGRRMRDVDAKAKGE